MPKTFVLNFENNVDCKKIAINASDFLVAVICNFMVPTKVDLFIEITRKSLQ